MSLCRLRQPSHADATLAVMMTYGVVWPRFWTGATGRALRQHGGPTAQLLALYLCTNHHANMLGLYPISLAVMAEEIPQTRACVLRGLAVADAEGFASYDLASGCVWVREMARFRLGLIDGERLAAQDKRVRGANALYNTLPTNPFLDPFFDHYGRTLHLRRRPARPVQTLLKACEQPVTKRGVAEA